MLELLKNYFYTYPVSCVFGIFVTMIVFVPWLIYDLKRLAKFKEK